MQDNPGNKQEKELFLIKLLPPRPDFHLDLSEKEMDIMNQHAVYWDELVDKGIVVVFGSVLDPKGHHFIGIVETENESRARAFIAEDPAVKSGLVKMEIYTMLATRRK